MNKYCLVMNEMPGFDQAGCFARDVGTKRFSSVKAALADAQEVVAFGTAWDRQYCVYVARLVRGKGWQLTAARADAPVWDE